MVISIKKNPFINIYDFLFKIIKMHLSRCLAAKGDGASECQKFSKYYRSLCPGEWVCSISICMQGNLFVFYPLFNVRSVNIDVRRLGFVMELAIYHILYLFYLCKECVCVLVCSYICLNPQTAFETAVETYCIRPMLLTAYFNRKFWSGHLFTLIYGCKCSTCDIYPWSHFFVLISALHA